MRALAPQGLHHCAEQSRAEIIADYMESRYGMLRGRAACWPSPFRACLRTCRLASTSRRARASAGQAPHRIALPVTPPLPAPGHPSPYLGTESATKLRTSERVAAVGSWRTRMRRQRIDSSYAAARDADGLQLLSTAVTYSVTGKNFASTSATTYPMRALSCERAPTRARTHTSGKTCHTQSK